VTFLQIAGSNNQPNQYIAGSPSTNLNVGPFVALVFNPSVNSSNWGSGATLVCPTLGYYTVGYVLVTPSVAANRQVVFRLVRNGGVVIDTGTVEVGDFGNPGHVGMLYNAVFNVGETLQIHGSSWQGQTITVGGGQLIITYVPTPTYRR